MSASETYDTVYFSYLRDRACSVLEMLENVVLRMGRDSLYATLCDVSSLFLRSCVTCMTHHEKHRMTFGEVIKSSYKVSKIKEMTKTGKKIVKHRSPVQTRLTSFPTLSVYALVGISLSTSETDDRFSLSK